MTNKARSRIEKLRSDILAGAEINWMAAFADLMDIILEYTQPEVKEEAWPKDGDEFWYIGLSGPVYLREWGGHEMDEDLLEYGNCFRTKKEAEAEAEYTRVNRKARKIANSLGSSREGPPLLCTGSFVLRSANQFAANVQEDMEMRNKFKRLMGSEDLHILIRS